MIGLNKIYENIFGMAIISVVIALVIKVSGFNPVFEISILDYTLQSTYDILWFLMGVYFFYLSLPYFLIGNSKLKPIDWLLNTHYLTIVLFFVGMMVFSCIDLNFFKNVMAEFDLSELDKIGLYAYTLFLVIILFALNILIFFLNLLFLRI